MQKKNWLKIALLAAAVLIISLFVVCIMKIEQNHYSAANTTPYTYPVVPGTNLWKQLDGHVEKVEACQIPKEIMKDMTTPALVETVINYPLMVDMLAYNTAEAGYEAVYNEFNGLRELEKRTDAILCLQEYINDLKLQTVSSGNSNDNTLALLYAEIIWENIIRRTK